MKIKKRHWNLYRAEFQKQKAELDSYKQALESCEEIMDVAKSRVDDLRERNKRQETTIATLQKEISRLKGEIQSLSNLARRQSESLASQELTLQRTVLENCDLREQISHDEM
jgi:chromosome segregation ATPase